MVDHATENAKDARARLSLATGVTGLASLATLLGFALAAGYSESQDDPTAAMIQLTPRAARAAQKLCNWETDARQVYGELRLVDLSRPVVTIALPGQEPGQPEDDAHVVFAGPQLRMRSSSIVVASQHAMKKDELTQPQCEVKP